MILRVAGALSFSLLVCASAGSAQVAWSDRTAAAGISHTAVLESDMNGIHMFNGGAVGDFDRDGWPDIFLLGGGGATADALYINNADGTFTDRASDWGIARNHRGRGATVGDFNRDGWPDLFVTSSGDLTYVDRVGTHILYRNNGNGTFTDVAAAAGVRQASPNNTTATGAAFGDYDLDGDLDLFVCTWEGFNGNRLFRNNGNGTFTDVTASAGIDYLFWGFSPRFVDMNGDRYPELLVAADFVTSRYFVNDGDGTFTRSTTSGTGREDNGMGSVVADFNRDGRPDWYVTSIYRDDGSIQDGNYLYVNQGGHAYTVLPEAAGARNGGWGWGAEAVDFDHDGWTDIVETNGWVEPQFMGETSYLFRNNGDMTFSEVQEGSGFDHTGQGRSLMALDYDRDGDIDIVITAFEGPVKLYRNDLSGPSTNWIQVRLDSAAEPGLAPDGYGSRVVVSAGGVAQYDWLDGGATYLGISECVSHFGVGSADTVDVTVEWADGSTTFLGGVPANRSVIVSPAMNGSAGEASSPVNPADQLRASYDKAAGTIDLEYVPACNASNHTIYFGDLANVASHSYAGSVCGIGSSGSASFDAAGIGSSFFVVVGHTGVVEGSYGVDSSGAERPESASGAACDLPQDLAGTCDLP